MKKLALYMTGTLMAGMLITSCGAGQKGDAGADTLVSKSTSDSLCTLYGQMAGGFIGNELDVYARETNESYDKKEFLKGVMAVIGSEKEEAYLAGLSTGLRVSQDMKNMESQGVQVDRNAVASALRKALLADSVDMAAIRAVQDQYESMMLNVQMAAQQREEAKKAQQPEAVQNIKTGEAFINKMKTEDPNFRVTESGLGYVITNAVADAQPVTLESKVTIAYEGKFLDGKTFDANGNAVMVPGNGLIPGFTEALLLLKKGESGTFYIPGNLAYGAYGDPRVGIGPMQMLVFVITVNEVEPLVAPQQ